MYTCHSTSTPWLRVCTYVLILCNDARDETISKRLILATYVLHLCKRNMLKCKRSMLNVYSKLPPIFSQIISTKATWSKEKSSKPPEMVIPFLTCKKMLFHINKKWKIVLVSNLKVATCQNKTKTITKQYRVRLDTEAKMTSSMW